MENTINLRVLCALLPLAADKDIRKYLNSIYVEFQADKTIYVAMNGYMLGIYTEKAENKHPFNVIIPRDVVKLVKPVRSNGTSFFYGSLDFDSESKAGRILNLANDQDLGFKPIEGIYPDYARVVPNKTSGEPGQFDAEYLYAFAQVNKALGAKRAGHVKIDHNGAQGTALVHLTDANFLGVLAPFRP